MKTSKRLLIMAIVLGLLTSLSLYFYLDNLDDPAQAAADRTDVVVAKTTIPAHTRVNEDMLEVSSAYTDAVHPEAVSDTSRLVGGIARTEIIRGEQVLSSRVHTEEKRATLSYRIPENRRAVSIPVNEVTGVAGYITPGDKVDVLVTVPVDQEYDENGGTSTYTVFQKVVVLAIGEFPREIDNDESYLVNTATLKVTPEQAEVLAYFNLNGSFHLALRSPVDEEIFELDAYGTGNFTDFRDR